jgi:hypothetical protein
LIDQVIIQATRIIELLTFQWLLEWTSVCYTNIQ